MQMAMELNFCMQNPWHLKGPLCGERGVKMSPRAYPRAITRARASQLPTKCDDGNSRAMKMYTRNVICKNFVAASDFWRDLLVSCSRVVAYLEFFALLTYQPDLGDR